MADGKNLLLCYNKGCGQRFDPDHNKEDACQHHPGDAVFHDAYKGWSCCNKKCIDFTEFLGIKGCTKSRHSNVKPPEPPKPAVDKSKADEVIAVRENKPLNSIVPLERPSYDFRQITLKPAVSPALLEQIKGLTASVTANSEENVIVIGQSCKNKACKATYRGPASDNEVCTFHPGVPIFHEGMKYWSCCQKKTTDFAVFLEQPGCSEGSHVWIQKGSGCKKVKCRMDWHQTATHVIVSVFAKKYNPDLSAVKLNPIHLTVNLYFPEENSWYNLDIELRGIVDKDASSVSMMPSKVEIKLRKKEPGSWSKLDISRKTMADEESEETTDVEDTLPSQVDSVDLSDI